MRDAIGRLATLVALVGSNLAAIERDRNDQTPVQVSEPGVIAPLDTQEKPGSQDVFVKRTLEKQLIRDINKAISYLTKLAGDYNKGNPKRLKLLVKVLDLHFEQAVNVMAQESKAFDLMWDAWEKRGRPGQEPQQDQSKSRDHWRKVVAFAQQIVAESPSYARADRVIYNEAIAERYLGNAKGSADSLEALVASHRGSKLLKDAHFSLGEYFFAEADFRKASKNFTESLAKDNSIRDGWSYFKIAWCEFNLGRYQSALKTWKDTVQKSYEFKDQQRAASLRSQVLNDMLQAFVELKETDAAIAYYKKNKDAKPLSELLQDMGRSYARSGDLEQASRVWKMFVARYPDDRGLFEAKLQLIDIDFARQHYESVWRGIEELISNFASTGKWAEISAQDSKNSLEEKISLIAIYYPKKLHQLGQQSGKTALLLEAAKGYALYLRYYPQNKSRAEVLEYLGDIAYVQKDYQKAGDIYKELSLLGRKGAKVFAADGSVKRNIFRKSAANMLDSYGKNYLPQLRKMIGKKPNFGKKARPLSVAANSYFDACKLYMQWFPNDSKTKKTCEVFRSEAYYRAGYRNEAIEALLTVARNFSGDIEGLSAVNRLIPILQNDPQRLKEVAKSLLAIASYRRGKIAKKLEKLLRGLRIEEIAGLDKSKRAQSYENEALSNPSDSEADKFLFNAGNDYLSVGDVTAAIRVFTRLSEKYPKSDLLAPVLLNLAQLLDQGLEAKRASYYYRRFLAVKLKGKERVAVQERICRLAILSNYKTAWDKCKDFALKYKEVGSDIVTTLLAAAEWAKNPGYLEFLISKVYLRYFKPSVNGKVVAWFKLYRLGSRRQKSLAAKKIVRFAGVAGLSGEGLRHVAQVKFLSEDSQRRRIEALGLHGGSIKRLQASIQRLNRGLVKLENSYARVLQLKEPYSGVAVFAVLGAGYARFASYLESPPSIRGATKAAVTKQLSASAVSLRAKSKSYFEAAMRTSKKFAILNKWAITAFNAVHAEQGIVFDDWIPLTRQIGFFGPEVLQEAIDR